MDLNPTLANFTRKVQLLMGKEGKAGYLILLLLFFLVTQGFAQTAIIKGFVFDEETGEPLIFTNVAIEGTTIGVSTDVNGYFSLTKVPAGTHMVVVSSIGYEDQRKEFTVKDFQIVNTKLFVKKSTIKLKAVQISARKQEKQNTVKMSVTKLTPKEMSKIPTIGGDPDLAQVLQVQPGVVFTGDQGGQLYIRGGSPIQNKVLLDGMTIYNPFHSIGLFSVFDTDIMRNADIYTGGFSAEYGGRISSIMDITTRDGNKNRLSGKVGLTTFGAKVLLEGPISKPKEVGGGSTSLLVSYKNSYLDQSSDVFYSYIDQELPFNYQDYYSKLSINAKGGSKLNLFGFSFNDEANFTGITETQWNNWGVGANSLIVPGQAKVLIELNLSYSAYEISQREAANESQDLRRSAIDGFSVGMDFTSFSGNDQIKYGFEMLGNQTDFSFVNNIGRTIEQVQNTTELAGYFNYRINAGKVIIEPGFRVQYYASLSTVSPEPRLGFKYNVTNDFRIKAAAGIYSQNLISANSDRDVVNLFSGFLTGPETLQETFVTKNGDVRDVTHKLQKANHFILGFEEDITDNIELNIEGYYKDFTQLSNINRNKIYDISDDTKPAELRNDFIVETGEAYGVDFVVTYRFEHLSFWTVYSISKVTRWDGTQEYRTVFDRRHNVNLVASYTFGKDLNWEFGARWNFGSGFPFTQTQGFFEKLVFDDLTDDYTSQNGELGIQYGELNGAELPTYHRLDVNLKRRFLLTENSILEVNASCTNVYDRQNIFYFDRVSYNRVDQLPIMPSLGVSLSF